MTGAGEGTSNARTGEPTVAAPGKTLGQVAYEAYIEFSDGKSLVTGESLPTWHDQDPVRQQAWDIAGHAVARVVQEDR